MSPGVFQIFLDMLLKVYATRQPQAVLEVGASNTQGFALVGHDLFKAARRVVLNMVPYPQPSAEIAACECVLGNTNAMPFFEDASFDCVLSSSVLEHDKYFWKSTQEIYRVLKPGGVFIVGVPIYMTLPTDWQNTTLTFKRHGMAYNADFYRFSEQAVREVILEQFTVLDSVLVRKYPNPYLVMSGIKQ